MPVPTALSHDGRMNYHSGVAAEVAVERAYRRKGYVVAARRWRGNAGEIDLIFRQGTDLVFVEVKKSASFDRARHRISFRQQRRILAAATEFAASEPRGMLSDMRVDAALVNATGEVEILQNAIGEF
ncbi:MAG: YraN family protein [Roseobacter sp.]